MISVVLRTHSHAHTNDKSRFLKKIIQILGWITVTPKQKKIKTHLKKKKTLRTLFEKFNWVCVCVCV
mgnify:CR=1 FL=1